MFNNFSKIRTLYEIMSKSIVETEGQQMTSQYGAYALRAGLASVCACTLMHTPTPTRPGNHMHTRTHEQARTHRPIYDT
jgi:hypothetical protein